MQIGLGTQAEDQVDLGHYCSQVRFPQFKIQK